jgi:hypothetical protein
VNRPLCHTPRLLLALTLATVSLLCGGATAGASEEPTSPIVGVWTFNGGEIAVKPLGKGTYIGVVVSPTTFAECTHETGEQIWSEIKEQSDGYYWGLHQWFEADCKRNPKLGPTAWRVLQEPSGARYMRVCFSHPDTSQPKISPDGTSEGVTYGCYNSTPIAPLPVVQGSSSGGSGSGSPGGSGGGEKGPLPTVETLSLPSAKKCLAAKLFVIRLKDPRYDPFKTVTIVFKGHKLKTVRHGAYVTATINLAGVHGKSFTVKVKATTVLGHTLSATRSYHRCAKHKAGKGHKKG